MKLRDFPLLTDQNIPPAIVAFLRQEGFDVLDVTENNWQGMDDTEILNRAYLQNRVVVSHDGDFGSLTIQKGEPLIGIFYLRPGHNDPIITMGTILAVLTSNPDLTAPFLLVAKRSGQQVTIRIRHLQP